MRLRLTALLFSLVLSLGCSSSTQPPASGSQTAAGSPASATAAASSPLQPSSPTAPTDAVTAKPRVDACALLTSNEIAAVQGEPVKETKLTGQSTGGISISQCFFTLPTFTNSVSLVVAHKGEGAGATEPKDFWRDTFHKDKSEDDQDRKKGREEEEESAPPQQIAGVGDEAYWTGSRVGGVL